MKTRRRLLLVCLYHKIISNSLNLYAQKYYIQNRCKYKHRQRIIYSVLQYINLPCSNVLFPTMLLIYIILYPLVLKLNLYSNRLQKNFAVYLVIWYWFATDFESRYASGPNLLLYSPSLHYLSSIFFFLSVLLLPLIISRTFLFSSLFLLLSFTRCNVLLFRSSVPPLLRVTELRYFASATTLMIQQYFV